MADKTPRNLFGYQPPDGGRYFPLSTPPVMPEPSKSTIKARPTTMNHTAAQLTEDGSEFIDRDTDAAGELKVGRDGSLRIGAYRCRTFILPSRGNKLFMLATECARVLGYRDQNALFSENSSLCMIYVSWREMEELFRLGFLNRPSRLELIAIVTARSMFRQFGSQLVFRGHRVRDDYWESEALQQGFTEADAAGATQPGASKRHEAPVTVEAATAASATVSSREHDFGGWSFLLGLVDDDDDTKLHTGYHDHLVQTPQLRPIDSAKNRHPHVNSTAPLSKAHIIDSSSVDLDPRRSGKEMAAQTSMDGGIREYAVELKENMIEIREQMKGFKNSLTGFGENMIELRENMTEVREHMNDIRSCMTIFQDFITAIRVGNDKYAKDAWYRSSKPSVPSQHEPVEGANMHMRYDPSSNVMNGDSRPSHADQQSPSTSSSSISSPGHCTDMSPEHDWSQFKDEEPKNEGPDEDKDSALIAKVKREQSPADPMEGLPSVRQTHKAKPTATAIQSLGHLPASSSSSSTEKYQSDGSESESSSDQTSDVETVAEWEHPQSLLAVRKTKIAYGLLQQYDLLKATRKFPVEQSIRSHATREGEIHPRNGRFDGSSVGGSSTPSSQAKGKRRRETNDDEGNERGRARRPANSGDSLGTSDATQLWACPFYKRDRHRHRSCGRTVLKSISRVKFHLKRYHQLQRHCHRCSKAFANESEEVEHARLEIQCPLQAQVQWDGLTEEQNKELSTRAPSKSSERERWYQIYELLFPGENAPESPFLEGLESQELRQILLFAESTGPSIVNRIMADLPERERVQLQDSTTLLNSVTQEFLNLLFKRWESENRTNTDSARPRASSRIGSHGARVTFEPPSTESAGPLNTASALTVLPSLAPHNFNAASRGPSLATSFARDTNTDEAFPLGGIGVQDMRWDEQEWPIDMLNYPS